MNKCPGRRGCYGCTSCSFTLPRPRPSQKGVPARLVGYTGDEGIALITVVCTISKWNFNAFFFFLPSVCWKTRLTARVLKGGTKLLLPLPTAQEGAWGGEGRPGLGARGLGGGARLGVGGGWEERRVCCPGQRGGERLVGCPGRGGKKWVWCPGRGGGKRRASSRTAFALPGRSRPPSSARVRPQPQGRPQGRAAPGFPRGGQGWRERCPHLMGRRRSPEPAGRDPTGRRGGGGGAGRGAHWEL